MLQMLPWHFQHSVNPLSKNLLVRECWCVSWPSPFQRGHAMRGPGGGRGREWLVSALDCHAGCTQFPAPLINLVYASHSGSWKMNKNSQYFQNEDALKKTAESYQNQLKRQEQKYQALKAHAELKLVKWVIFYESKFSACGPDESTHSFQPCGNAMLVIRTPDRTVRLWSGYRC